MPDFGHLQDHFHLNNGKKALSSVEENFGLPAESRQLLQATLDLYREKLSLLEVGMFRLNRQSGEVQQLYRQSWQPFGSLGTPGKYLLQSLLESLNPGDLFEHLPMMLAGPESVHYHLFPVEDGKILSLAFKADIAAREVESIGILKDKIAALLS